MKTVEIFDEDNSIIIDDDYSTTDFTFYPEEKKIKVSSSVKNDCFYNNDTIEYKISADPIEIWMRTLESSHEPPLEYSIKDGVILESEIKKKNSIFPDRIENLKKEVEWSKVPLFGNYEVNLYILSKHPEIISKEDYKRFLRQSAEKIKIGVSKIEEAVKTDSHGLEIYKSEYGKNIWYINSESEKKEMDEYYDLPEKKRKDTNYAKKLEYIEKFNNSLFDEKSPKYVGIPNYEFKMSVEILEYIEKLLDKKEIVASEDSDAIKKNPWRWLGYTWTIIINLITIGVVLAIYDKVYANFEIIVVSILILIYLSLQSFSMIYGRTIWQTALGLDVEFKRIRKLLKNEPNKDEKDEMQEAKKTVNEAMIKMYINAAFLFIIYLITLLHLFGALQN
ncbi:MAG: hypothetical protein NTY12_02700 [Candidatus Falkowbacteria bacterium]|nr:hypothetical protein [Candidatus Falkowbacteria bacterium]